MYWLDEYHADGLRVDGVTSMLYLNFGISDKSKMRFNKYGDETDLEAVEFLKEFNYMIGNEIKGAVTVAEESTAWPMVTQPPSNGGLGFHFKWNMGWMNDTLEYMSTDFPWREGAHNKLTFSMTYAYSENYVLPLSHDEVVHGKKSLIGRMPGDIWRQFAGTRLLAMYQMTFPGKKLNFMGHEIAQFIEWREYEGLEWFLLGYENHEKHQKFVKDLNHIYTSHPALWSDDNSWEGFKWINANDADRSIFSFARYDETKKKALLFALLQPDEELKALQDEGKFTKLMVLQEELKTLPFGDVWDEYCRRCGKPVDGEWFSEIEAYEAKVLEARA